MPMKVLLKPPGKENFYPLRELNGELRTFDTFDNAMGHLKTMGYFDEADCDIVDIAPPEEEE